MPHAFYLTRRDGTALGGHECRESASASITGEWSRPDSGIHTKTIITRRSGEVEGVMQNIDAYMRELSELFQTSCKVTVVNLGPNSFSNGIQVRTAIDWDGAAPVEVKHLWWWVALIQRLAVQTKPVDTPTVLELLQSNRDRDSYSLYAESNTGDRMCKLWMSMCKDHTLCVDISRWLNNATSEYYGPINAAIGLGRGVN